MRISASLAIFLLYGCNSQSDGRIPPFRGETRFDGKLELTSDAFRQYLGFRSCGRPEGCADAFRSCHVQVASGARSDWNHLIGSKSLPYWIEFVGSEREASTAERLDRKDPKECMILVRRILAACESASPIYPDEDGKMPTCATNPYPDVRTRKLPKIELRDPFHPD